MTPKKVRGNDVDYLLSKITWKRYVKIWSAMYRHNIGVDSRWCVRWVGTDLYSYFYVNFNSNLFIFFHGIVTAM